MKKEFKNDKFIPWFIGFCDAGLFKNAENWIKISWRIWFYDDK